MSKRLVLIVLGVIIFLNVFVIGYVLIDRAVDNSDDDKQTQEDTKSEQTPEENQEGNKEEQASDTETETATDSDSETPGSIVNGAYDENEKELNAKAIEKSDANKNLMEELGKWVATNYAPEDINTKTYEVQKGDTLWEISEAYYGTGHDWHKILELNKDEVGFLPNGSQALIIPGQVLVLE